MATPDFILVPFWDEGKVPPDCPDPCDLWPDGSEDNCMWNDCTYLIATLSPVCIHTPGGGECPFIINTYSQSRIFERNADPIPGQAEFECTEDGFSSKFWISRDVVSGHLVWSWIHDIRHWPGWDTENNRGDCEAPGVSTNYYHLSTGTVDLEADPQSPGVISLCDPAPTTQDMCGEDPPFGCPHGPSYLLLTVQVVTECEENPECSACSGFKVYGAFCIAEPD